MICTLTNWFCVTKIDQIGECQYICDYFWQKRNLLRTSKIEINDFEALENMRILLITIKLQMLKTGKNIIRTNDDKDAKDLYQLEGNDQFSIEGWSEDLGML